MIDRDFQDYKARSRGLFVKRLLVLTDGNKTEAAKLAEVTVPAIIYIEDKYDALVAIRPEGVAFEGGKDALDMIVESLASFTRRAKAGYCFAMSEASATQALRHSDTQVLEVAGR